MSPALLVRRAIDQGGRKALRYSAVSVVGVAITQALILALHGPAALSATVTNVIAVSLASIPAYFLNRAWVWGKRGRSHLRREVLPFWGFALAGLGLSTVAVTVVTQVWETPIAVNVSNMAAFGVLWVVKYMVLDALIFGEGTALESTVAGGLERSLAPELVS